MHWAPTKKGAPGFVGSTDTVWDLRSPENFLSGTTCDWCGLLCNAGILRADGNRRRDPEGEQYRNAFGHDLLRLRQVNMATHASCYRSLIETSSPADGRLPGWELAGGRAQRLLVVHNRQIAIQKRIKIVISIYTRVVGAMTFPPPKKPRSAIRIDVNNCMDNE